MVVGAGGSVAAVGVVVGVVEGTVGPSGSALEITSRTTRVAVRPLLEPVSVTEVVRGATDASTLILTVVVDRVIGLESVVTRTPRGTERDPRKMGDVKPFERTAVSVSVVVVPGAIVTVPWLTVREKGTFVTACVATRGTALAVAPRTPTDKSNAARRGRRPSVNERMVNSLGSNEATMSNARWLQT